MSRLSTSSDEALRIDLAQAIGFNTYPKSRAIEPYLNYILNRYIGRGSLDEYVQLFRRILEYCTSRRTCEGSPATHSIQSLLNVLSASDNEELFSDTKAGSKTRKDDVEDTVMYMLGVWTMMLSSFVQLPNGLRKVTAVFGASAGGQNMTGSPYSQSLEDLIRGSTLLPSSRNDTEVHASGRVDDITQTAARLVALLSTTSGLGHSVDEHTGVRGSLLAYSLDSSTSRMQESHYMPADVDSLESLSIKATRLNAFTLSVLGAVDIFWTQNFSRHMLLSRNGRGYGRRHVLEVFALPCIFDASTLTSRSVGIPAELAQEILESYTNLFNAWPELDWHIKLGRYLGIRHICSCWACSAFRFRKRTLLALKNHQLPDSRLSRRHRASSQRSEFDPKLEELMNGSETSDWTHELFPTLWSRIVVLEEHLQNTKPWSIWTLLRDRRDTLQFWTFLFATVVVFLTILQVALGVAQVVGSFNPRR